MKVGHFNTVFRASLLLFSALSSFVALSDGSCHLEQFGDGTFRIVCEGGTIVYTQEIITNNVYIVQNCEELKAELLSSVDNIGQSFTWSINTANEIETTSAQMIASLTPENDPMGDINGGLTSIKIGAAGIYENLLLARDSLIRGDDSLRAHIENIQCGSCSTNNIGSCCDVDLTPILRELNDANLLLASLTNLLSGGSISTASSMQYYFMGYNMRAQQQRSSTYSAQTVSSYLRAISDNITRCVASVNNYLYKVSLVQLPNISNNLEIAMSATTNILNVTTDLYVESTNHFSFFREMSVQDSPLTDFGQQSTFDSYYDFLTNHYLKVSFKQYNDLAGDEKEKTNWFSRVETLLAALVFNDSDGTNTVDVAYGQSQRDNLINSLDGITQTSTTQVDLMSDMGDSLLSSLRSLNSSFSSAVSMPGEVKLVSVGQDNSLQSNTIKFQSSEISQLVEACRCATTLAWCFGGIWLLFLFVSWSIKTSYSLCVFCWSVVSAIFGGGKT